MTKKTSSLLLTVFLFFSFSFTPLALSIHSNATSLNLNYFPKRIDNSSYCFEIERKALLDFKQGLEDPFHRLSNWHGANCCAWLGVSCNRWTRHVTKLDLRNSYKSSYARSFYLGGNINPSLVNLEFLNYLDLSKNNFQYSKIPSFIGSLKQLSYLNLSDSSFYGLVPSHLGNLSSLRYLDLYDSSYDSLLWVFDLNWITRLESLKYLNMGGVNLSLTSTNLMQSVSMLPSLSELYLSDCKLDIHNPSSLFVNLTYLSVLDLSSNYASNFSTIPLWIFNITTLVELSLANSEYKSSLSDVKYSWGNLCNLESLDLSQNGFQGEMDYLLGSVSRCGNTSLQIINLNENKITGYLPNSLTSLKYLKRLSVSYNSLSGPIPISIGNLSCLEYIDLNYNKMSGSIPSSIGQLKELNSLLLYSNSWEGIMSQVHFQNLTKLKFLQVSSENNSLSLKFSKEWTPLFSLSGIEVIDCYLEPSFPTWLSSQKELSSIILENVNMKGTIPSWFWKLAPRLQWLDLSMNQLCGKLPRSLEFGLEAYLNLKSNNFTGSMPLWSNLSALSLRNNFLSGAIPMNIGQVYANLIVLDLSRNFFSGSIPSSMVRLTRLQTLFLSNNHFSGEIPKRWKGFDNLYHMELSNNNFSGYIPKSLCLDIPWLQQLQLNDNNISGDLSHLKKCKSLDLLDVGANKLTGAIPKQIDEYFPSLMALRLRSNKLSGTIPKQLCLLSRLHVLDLALNNLSGSIPSCIGHLVSFQSSPSYTPTYDPTYMFAFGDGMDLVMKGKSLEFTEKQVGIINTVDLSRNCLTGMIPKEITNLTLLKTLNLSWNQLHGPIPENTGDLHQLETLDLSGNNLEGIIPQSMISMTALSHLNLSHNNLSGRIPSTNQFATFNDPSNYEGNPRLCGSPLLTNCGDTKEKDDNEDVIKDDNEDVIKDEDEDKYDKVWLYTGLAVGFATGFWAIFGALVIKKSWRYSYFRFIEEKKDRILVIVALTKARVQRKLCFQKD